MARTHRISKRLPPPLESKSVKSSHSFLDLATRAEINHAVHNSTSASSSKQFLRTKTLFTQFCHDRKIPKEHIFPAGEDLVCAFAVSFAGKLSGSTLRVKISALKKWTLHRGKPWHWGAKLQSVLEHVKKVTPATSHSGDHD